MTNTKKPQSARQYASRMFSTFAENESTLRRYLRRFTSNTSDIEDICQETVLRALQAEKRREIEEPRGFLFGIARNVVRSELERQSRSLLQFVENFTPDTEQSNNPSTEQILDARKQMIRFTEAAATLPAQCQKVFLMKKVYGYSHKEIADNLGISVSTVEKHVAAGFKRTLDYLAKQDDVAQPTSAHSARGSGTER
ncbi:MAG: RNA polymerase sigma factor [Pseudomonadota bacterium]